MGPYSHVSWQPDVSAEERRACELIKRIRKLRWMGMDDEAHQLELVICGTRIQERFWSRIHAKPISMQRVNTLKVEAAGLSEMAQNISQSAPIGAISAQVLAGGAAIVLGILALTTSHAPVLTLIGLPVLGGSVAVSGTALTGRMLRFSTTRRRSNARRLRRERRVTPAAQRVATGAAEILGCSLTAPRQTPRFPPLHSGRIFHNQNPIAAGHAPHTAAGSPADRKTRTPTLGWTRGSVRCPRMAFRISWRAALPQDQQLSLRTSKGRYSTRCT